MGTAISDNGFCRADICHAVLHADGPDSAASRSSRDRALLSLDAGEDIIKPANRGSAAVIVRYRCAVFFDINNLKHWKISAKTSSADRRVELSPSNSDGATQIRIDVP